MTPRGPEPPAAVAAVGTAVPASVPAVSMVSRGVDRATLSLASACPERLVVTVSTERRDWQRQVAIPAGETTVTLTELKPATRYVAVATALASTEMARFAT